MLNDQTDRQLIMDSVNWNAVLVTVKSHNNNNFRLNKRKIQPYRRKTARLDIGIPAVQILPFFGPFCYTLLYIRSSLGLQFQFGM